MSEGLVFGLILVAISIGIVIGRWAEAEQWRHKGDHEYMNRKESGGRLYTVQREDQ